MASLLFPTISTIHYWGNGIDWFRILPLILESELIDYLRINKPKEKGANSLRWEVGLLPVVGKGIGHAYYSNKTIRGDPNRTWVGTSYY